jgi:hypothetical protein
MDEYESASESTDTEASSEGDYVFDGFAHPQYLEQTPFVRDMRRYPINYTVLAWSLC